jgi:hypothetical protein
MDKDNLQPESEILTKFADVKSRISWTADRQQLLREMWGRGDKTSVIAEALGCKVGVVNMARARFGLTPRRIVPGRPKQVPDEPAHKIERVAFTTSRLMERACKSLIVVHQRFIEFEDVHDLRRSVDCDPRYSRAFRELLQMT